MSQPPEFYLKMKEQSPDVMRAYEALGEAARTAGPLDANGVALVKLALSVGAAMEGATHSSVRKALGAGCTAEEIRHVVLFQAIEVVLRRIAHAVEFLPALLQDQHSVNAVTSCEILL